MADPALAADRRQALVNALMAARRAVGAATRDGDRDAEAAARAEVNRAKIALGERGPVWWNDDAPDLNRKMVGTTCYAGWFDTVRNSEDARTPPHPA